MARRATDEAALVHAPAAARSRCESIVFACSACEFTTRVPVAAVGRRARCPRCATSSVVVPARETRPPITVDAATDEVVDVQSASRTAEEQCDDELTDAPDRDDAAEGAMPGGDHAVAEPTDDSAAVDAYAPRSPTPAPQPILVEWSTPASEAEAGAIADEEAGRTDPAMLRRTTRRHHSRSASRQAIMPVVLAVMAAGAIIAWSSRPHAARAVAAPAAAAIAAVDAPASAASSGTVVANAEVDIISAASGTIGRLPFDIGDQVAAGAVVAELDTAVEDGQVRQAQAQLAMAQGQLAQARQNLLVAQRKVDADAASARAAVAAAESRQRDAAARAERMARMLDKTLCSVEDAQSARELALQAQADLEAAQAHVAQVEADALAVEVHRQDVAIAEGQAHADEVALEAARRGLAGTRLTAPIAGVVCARPARLGAHLDQHAPETLMTIADVSRLFVVTQVAEGDLGRIAIGGEVAIRVPAFPQRAFAGRVDRIAARGQRGDGGATTFEVRVEAIGEARDVLRPAMNAAIEFGVGDGVAVRYAAADHP